MIFADGDSDIPIAAKADVLSHESRPCGEKVNIILFTVDDSRGYTH